MTFPNPIDVVKVFPDYFSSGLLYHCNDDFFLVRNPRFTSLCGRRAQLSYTVYVILTRGSVKCEIDGQPIEVSAGSSIVALSKQYVMLNSCSDDLESMLYFFTREVADSLLVGSSYAIFKEIQRQPVVTLDEFSMHVLTQTFGLLETTLSHPEADQMLDVCISIINTTFRLAAPQNLLEVPNKDMENRDESLTLQFVAAIEKHYRKQHEVQFYAKLLCVTPKYLSTCVKKASGSPANQWINRYIMRDAKNMLAFGNLPIKEISRQLGFDDQLLFGKYFRRQTGMSPTQFRQQNIK